MGLVWLHTFYPVCPDTNLDHTHPSGCLRSPPSDGGTRSNNSRNIFALFSIHRWTISPGRDTILRQANYVYLVWTFPKRGSLIRIPCLDKSATDVYGRKQNDQVEVELDMDIVDISTLDVVEEEISVEINLVQTWNDSRCRYEVNDGITSWLRHELKESQSQSDSLLSIYVCWFSFKSLKALLSYFNLQSSMSH